VPSSVSIPSRERRGALGEDLPAGRRYASHGTGALLDALSRQFAVRTVVPVSHVSTVASIGDGAAARQHCSMRTLTRSAVMDERVARVVAAATVVIAAGVLLTGWWAVLLPLVADFAVRASGHPTWSPLAQLSRTQVVERLRGDRRPVAAGPKQLATGIGALVSGSAAVAALVFGAVGFSTALMAMLAAAAFLEAAFGFCIGCRLYALLASTGVVADDCPECSDISAPPLAMAKPRQDVPR